MKRFWPDISPEEEEQRIETYRRMTPAEKIAEMGRLNQEAAQLVFADVRQRYPDAPEREIWLRVASRTIPTDLMRKAFGWDPDEKGY